MLMTEWEKQLVLHFPVFYDTGWIGFLRMFFFLFFFLMVGSLNIFLIFIPTLASLKIKHGQQNAVGSKSWCGRFQL